MWKKQLKSSLPIELSEELWNNIFGSSTFKLIVDRYHFRSETSDITRILGEPGDIGPVYKSDNTNSISYIKREYYGKLAHLHSDNLATSIHVTLSLNTNRQNLGSQEWWHWGSASVPNIGVYGYVNPVQTNGSVRLSIAIGTDNSGEALFEQLFFRSKFSDSNPVIIYGRMKTIPIHDTRIGIISEYSIEHSIGL